MYSSPASDDNLLGYVNWLVTEEVDLVVSVNHRMTMNYPDNTEEKQEGKKK